MTHELKTINPYFEDIYSGSKRFELRKNDRDFQVGDKVNLNEYVPEKDKYTGRTVSAEISYILQGYDNSIISDDYCIFSIDIISKFPL